jgi:hypothetical protein
VTGAIFGLVGVFVGAFLTWFKDAWSDRRMRGRHARYLAIRIVCILDGYMKSCADVVYDDGLCEGQPNEQGFVEPQVPLPPTLTFPEDLDWKSIEHALMYRLLSMPSEIEAANHMIDAAWNYGDPEAHIEERQYQYAKLGLASFALTKEIRSKYDIPSKDLGEWNPVKRLMEATERIEKGRRDRGQRTANLLDAQPPPVS